MTGYIHSLESMGAVDGPGLRFVIFMAGCSLRCSYCHNPDTWDMKNSEEYTPEQLLLKVLRYKPYFKENGGVTVSGGEPLLQAEFVAELFKLLHENGIKTALDTSGTVTGEHVKAVLENTDLVMCDIKFPTQQLYERHCGGSFDTVMEFLSLAEKANADLWVRHVVIPSITDSKESIKQISDIAKSFSNHKKTQLLPFKKLCEFKYKELGIEFPFKNIPECDEETIKKLSEFCR